MLYPITNFGADVPGLWISCVHVKASRLARSRQGELNQWPFVVCSVCFQHAPCNCGLANHGDTELGGFLSRQRQHEVMEILLTVELAPEVAPLQVNGRPLHKIRGKNFWYGKVGIGQSANSHLVMADGRE